MAGFVTSRQSHSQRAPPRHDRIFTCLLDEPTAGVNPTLVNTILEALKHMNRGRGISIFVVEHNMRVISEICDHVYVLDAGTVVAEGPPDVVQRDDKVLDLYLGRGRRALH